MDDLALLIYALRGAGKIAMQYHGKKPKRWHKPDGSVLTEADLAVDDFLKSTIQKARPDDGWLSEETKDTPKRLSKTRLWIADPIDGTRPFAEGKPWFGTGMALVIDGKAELSALFCPATDKMFHAVKNGGAFCNAKPLPKPETGASIIVPKKAYDITHDAGLSVQAGADIPLLLRLSAIATGEHSGAVSFGAKNDWDIAPGHLLVTETGGLITNQAGEPLVYNKSIPQQQGLVAAHQKWHEQLINLLRDI
jgi:myo-inositol-1(or 4)-monophosphatase